MKSDAWFRALKAFARARERRGTPVKMSVGQAAEFMGCSPQTAKKHLNAACRAGLCTHTYQNKKGCIKTLYFHWVV